MKPVVSILIPLFFVSCVTPSRLGISYKGVPVVKSSYEINNNPNILLIVNPLTKQDNPGDLNKLKYRFIDCLKDNRELNKLLETYPDSKITLEMISS